jgi:hypothetical protein
MAELAATVNPKLKYSHFQRDVHNFPVYLQTFMLQNMPRSLIHYRIHMAFDSPLTGHNGEVFLGLPIVQNPYAQCANHEISYVMQHAG